MSVVMVVPVWLMGVLELNDLSGPNPGTGLTLTL